MARGGRGARAVVGAVATDGRRVAGRERLLRGFVGAVAVDDLGGIVAKHGAEAVLRALQRYAVLRSLRAGQRRLDRRQVELEPFGVGRLVVGVVPEALRLGVGLDQVDKIGGA